MKKVSIFIIIIFVLVFLFLGLNYTDGKFKKFELKEIVLDDLVGMSISFVYEYADKVDIKLDVKYEYSSSVEKDFVISQNINAGTEMFSGSVIELVVSKGNVPDSVYKEYGVNELGNVPIMMYHGIVDIKSNDTIYIGGNVDKDGYNRTAEAFRGDLEFYYNNGYRMISLNDYVDGIVDVELGKSPIILTFDDGNENNFKVLGEKNGELIIDPNSAVGILEDFKTKYPDYGVTATFFVNSSLFNQNKYNEKILKWLVEHGYDVGNHTMNHVDFTKIGVEETIKEVSGVYNILDGIVPNQYVNIIALPFGSPYRRNHSNYEAILGNVENVLYKTKAALRVGWEAEVSCFDVSFAPTFLKRIRAYDNNGKDFDIKMNFDLLENKRYVSDGDVNTIVALEKDQSRVVSGNRKVILY